MKRIITSLILIVSLMAVAGSAYAEQLDAKTQQALIDAIQDEYKARALYQKVMEKFGAIRPFSNIIKAEEQHIAELKPLFEKYELDIPQDEWYEKVPEFATVQEACEAGVKAEIENAEMYDEFFTFVKEQDITDTFTRLRDASQDKHLPAFQRCANTGDTGRGREGTGRGQGRTR
jgi:hypothetical protein